MGGPELSLRHDRVVNSQTSSCHEAQGLIYPMSQFTITA